MADIFGGGNHIIPPTVTVWDLNTDKLLHKYTLKPDDVTSESFFANIVSNSKYYLIYAFFLVQKEGMF